ncbi:uncharacterized protein [Amphiura filiformis]|uniref:uncharacterized protein n=1 Tax=Amphiura filiformis TaxID=82378 RepID=UPI003B212815
MTSSQIVIIGSSGGGGVLLIILILLVCILKRNSERKRERQQAESIPTSNRPTSLLDRTSEDPTAENTYQETALHTSPNQNNQRNDQEPDLSYAYASVSINRPQFRDPSSNDHQRNEDAPSTHDPELALEESYEYATVTKNHNISPNYPDERNRNEDTPSTSRTHGDRGQGPEVTYDYASVPISRPKQVNESNQQNGNINTQSKRDGSGQAPEEAYSYATVPIHRPNGSEQKLVIGDRSEDEEEGWMDNSIYDITEGNDADNKNETEGWEENTVYVSSDR